MNPDQQRNLTKFSKILAQLEPESDEYKMIMKMITDGYEHMLYVPPKFTSVSNNIIYTAKIEYRQGSSLKKGKYGDVLLHKNTQEWMRQKMHLKMNEWEACGHYYRRLIPKKP